MRLAFDLRRIGNPGIGRYMKCLVEAVLRRVAGALLEQLDVLDEYRGARLPEGTRGVTWRCTFRDPVKTLTEREIDALLSRMLTALEDELDVRRRQASSS